MSNFRFKLTYTALKSFLFLSPPLQTRYAILLHLCTNIELGTIHQQASPAVVDRCTKS